MVTMGLITFTLVVAVAMSVIAWRVVSNERSVRSARGGAPQRYAKPSNTRFGEQCCACGFWLPMFATATRAND